MHPLEKLRALSPIRRRAGLTAALAAAIAAHHLTGQPGRIVPVLLALGFTLDEVLTLGTAAADVAGEALSELSAEMTEAA